MDDRLKEPWDFRDRKNVSYAVCAMVCEKKHNNPFLMEQAPFRVCCAAATKDIDVSAFRGIRQKFFHEMMKYGIIEQSGTPMSLLPS